MASTDRRATNKLPALNSSDSGLRRSLLLSQLVQPLDRFLDQRGLLSPAAKPMLPGLQVFKEHPASNFVDAQAVGEELKVKFNLDRHAKRRLKEERARKNNEALKRRVEELIEERRKAALKGELQRLSVEERERLLQRRAEAKKARLRTLDALLQGEDCLPGIEATSRTNVNDLIVQSDRLVQKDLKLQQLITSETHRLAAEFALQEQLERLPEDLQAQQDRDQRQRFLQEFQKKMKQLLRNLEGKKTQRALRLAAMRRQSPARAPHQSPAEEHAQAPADRARELQQLRAHQAAQAQKQKLILRQMDEVDQTFDYLAGLRSPGSRTRLPQVSSRAHLPAELSPGDRSAAARKAPGSSFLQQSLASLDLPPSTPSRLPGSSASRLDLADASARFSHLIKSCYQNQLSAVRSPARPLQSPRGPGPLQAAAEERRFEEEPDKAALESLLTRGYGAQKTDPSSSKYAKKQNKFVSYRRYRENYLAVKGDVLTVLESDEK